MSLRIAQVKIEGPIFQPGIVPREITRPAMAGAIRYGTEILKNYTPVDTGRAQRGWTGLNNSIVNLIPYVIYLDEGTRYMQARNMTRKAIPQIESYLIRGTEARINAVLL